MSRRENALERITGHDPAHLGRLAEIGDVIIGQLLWEMGSGGGQAALHLVNRIVEIAAHLGELEAGHLMAHEAETLAHEVARFQLAEMSGDFHNPVHQMQRRTYLGKTPEVGRVMAGDSLKGIFATTHQCE
jgi:hypothetical protein